MFKLSERSNRLEQSTYHYQLQDVAEPQLYRDLFDYDSVPKVAFNHRNVPMYTPEELWITDTTFRDGQQSRSPFSAEQIAHLYSLLHKPGRPERHHTPVRILSLFRKGSPRSGAVPQ